MSHENREKNAFLMIQKKETMIIVIDQNIIIDYLWCYQLPTPFEMSNRKTRLSKKDRHKD
jgi:hypothetical protein